MSSADQRRSRGEIVAQRITEALAARRATGTRLGRPRQCPDDVLSRVVFSRADGATLTDIAESMNTDGVPTPGGGSKWYPSHVHRLLRTQDAQRLSASVAARARHDGSLGHASLHGTRNPSPGHHVADASATSSPAET